MSLISESLGPSTTRTMCGGYSANSLRPLTKKKWSSVPTGILNSMVQRAAGWICDASTILQTVSTEARSVNPNVFHDWQPCRLGLADNKTFHSPRPQRDEKFFNFLVLDSFIKTYLWGSQTLERQLFPNSFICSLIIHWTNAYWAPLCATYKVNLSCEYNGEKKGKK